MTKKEFLAFGLALCVAMCGGVLIEIVRDALSIPRAVGGVAGFVWGFWSAGKVWDLTREYRKA